MNQIPGHIRYLLLLHKEVTVEGLGTFSSHYDKAYYNPSEGLFIPPKITLCFASGKAINNHLLEESISRKENIPISEARKTVNYFVNFIKTAIRWNDCVRIPGLGIMSQEADDSISLLPAEDYTETFIGNGLSPIIL